MDRVRDAARASRKPCAKKILRCSTIAEVAKLSPFRWADVDPRLLEALLDAGLDPNGDYGGRRLVHVYFRHIGKLRLLASRGARFDARDSKGRTPLHLASETIDARVIPCYRLVARIAGANTFAVDDEGFSPADRRAERMAEWLRLEREEYHWFRFNPKWRAIHAALDEIDDDERKLRTFAFFPEDLSGDVKTRFQKRKRLSQ